MALKKTLLVGSLLASMAFGGTTDAQSTYTPSAAFEHRPIERPDSTGPMVTPGVFNYDAQMFAPFEFTNDKELEPNCGFFFTFDKTFTHVPRSRVHDTTRADVPIGGNWNWGERYQFGWVTEEDAGWNASFQTSAGVYRAQGAHDENLLFRGFDLTGMPLTAGQLSAFGSTILTVGLPGNTFLEPFGGPATYSNTFNIGELNRSFRQELSGGGYMEPYIGGRFTNVNDRSLEDRGYRFVNDDTQQDGTSDKVGHRFRQTSSNNAIGLQFGGRYNKRRGRFLYSTDGSLAASYNQQRYTSSNILFGEVEQNRIDEQYFEDNNFLPSFDLEFGISYNVTRDLTVRAGTQLLYIWEGIARVNTLPAPLNPNSILTNPAVIEELRTAFSDKPGVEGISEVTGIGSPGIFNDDYVAAGFTFGVEWRR